MRLKGIGISGNSCSGSHRRWNTVEYQRLDVFRSWRCVRVLRETDRWAPLESPLPSRQTKAPFTAGARRKAFHPHACSDRSYSKSGQRTDKNPLNIKSAAGAAGSRRGGAVNPKESRKIKKRNQPDSTQRSSSEFEASGGSISRLVRALASVGSGWCQRHKSTFASAKNGALPHPGSCASLFA